jgi:signal transduction histidine kinase
LGLHIVHNIVFGMLGGEIKLQKCNAPGACFVIRIPLSAPLSFSQGTPSAFSV